MLRTNAVMLLTVGALLTTACSANSGSDDEAKDDPNFKQGIYVNNHIDHPNKSFWTFLKLRWFGEEQWADYEKAADLIPKTIVDLNQLESNQSQVTWIGHSSFLLQLGSVNILTDPVFSERASPVSFAGPKRYTLPALMPEQLPKIDAVVISHNHYDHLDEKSIRALGNEPMYFVPSGLKAWFIDVGIDPSRVQELRWWQKLELDGFGVTALPSQHWSARGLGDRHKTHWASWLINAGGKTLWFAGDTGYNDKDFVEIGNYIAKQHQQLDIALIPIGAYGPRHFMKTYHVNTEEAVQIHRDVQARFSIGMHWGAFPLTSEWPMEPYEWLNRLRDEGKVGTYPFETLKIGETIRVQQ